MADVKVRFMRGHPEHVHYIEVQNQQAGDKLEMLKPDVWEAMSGSAAISGWYGNRCLGLCGLRPLWHGRYEGWALLSRHAAPHMLPITRRVRQSFEELPRNSRIEMVARADFPEARRWAKALGFTCETPNGMPGFNMDGTASYLYARVSWL